LYIARISIFETIENLKKLLMIILIEENLLELLRIIN